MKKILSAVILAGSIVPMAAMAADHPHSPPGGADCGMIGSAMQKGKSGLVSHLMGITTNQTGMSFAIYGVTTGTLGCDTKGAISPIFASYEQKKSFVASNMDSLAQDAANGNGAYLAALAGLMGVLDEDKVAFNSVMKANYGQMFGAEQADSVTVLSAMDQALSADGQLAKYAR